MTYLVSESQKAAIYKSLNGITGQIFVFMRHHPELNFQHVVDFINEVREGMENWETEEERAREREGI